MALLNVFTNVNLKGVKRKIFALLQTGSLVLDLNKFLIVCTCNACWYIMKRIQDPCNIKTEYFVTIANGFQKNKKTVKKSAKKEKGSCGRQITINKYSKNTA